MKWLPCILALTSTFYFHASSQSTSLDSIQPNNLWDQIALRLAAIDGPTLNLSSALNLCAATALCRHGSQSPMVDSETLQTLDSLHMFDLVLDATARNNLVLGKFCIAHSLAQIQTDLDVIQKRQDLLLFFKNNPEVTQELQTLLKSLHQAEMSFLWNFFPGARSNEDTDADGLNAVIDAASKLKKKIDSNQWISEPYQRMNQLAVITSWLYIMRYIYNFNAMRDGEYTGWKLWINAWHGNATKECTACHAQIPQLNGKPVAMTSLLDIPGIPTFLSLATLINVSWQAVKFTMHTKSDFDDIYRKQITLMHVRHLFNTTTKIHALLQQHPELHPLLEAHSEIALGSSYAHKNNTVCSPKMTQFLQLLHSSTFNGNPSYYVSFQGRIIETFTLFEEIRSQIVPIWEALGDIDAYISTAQLLNSQQTAYCLATLTDDAIPTIQAHNYWHAALPIEKAVTNSINIGGTNSLRNIVITGANAGGKTTALTALMIAQIMSQTLGIAPAQSYTATIFTRLNTYLDITTNLAANESLFMAQANRAEKLFQSITSCSSNQKSFTILDEIFTGTRADFAENASFEFAKTIGAIPNSICLLATHFPKLTELEKLELFSNYHAQDARINADDTLTYPYKIIPGISTQNIAAHILKLKNIFPN
ncbi:hypothetical protein KBD08_00925 [Candidatus Babeliales bacterium]|nr:hypothetical protein [Candidatus Babeliales bacterium]